MAWRKWIIRGLVYTFVLVLVGLFVTYQILTNPIATRQTVLKHLARKFPGAVANVDSARMNLFDGISVSELRMARRDDLDRSDFLHVPSATLYLDKEQVLDGKLLLRKIVLNRPQLRLVIDRTGHCNLMGLLAPITPNERMPTFVLHQASLLIEDHRVAVGRPIVEIHNLQATILNDPLPQVVVEMRGQTDVLGPIKIHAEMQRGGGAVTANVELSSISVGPTLVQRLADLVPDLAAHLRQCRANSKVQATLNWQPLSSTPLTCNVVCQILDGQLTHARIPFTLDKIEGEAHLVNDPPPEGSYSPGETCLLSTLLNLRVSEAHVTAQAGSTRLAGSLKDLVLGRTGISYSHPITQEDELPARELTWQVEHLPVNPDLFRYLPESLQPLRDDFKPCGPLSVIHTYQRPRPGTWTKTYRMLPEGMEMEFVRFPYPIHTINGSVERVVTSEGSNKCVIDLNGFGGDRPVVLRGTIEGERETAGYNLVLQATDVPIDERLHRALPTKSQVLAAQFHPTGLADVQAFIQRTRGQREFSNRYLVNIHDATLNYDLFPYFLTKVSGVLEIFHNKWECRGFKGNHREGVIELHGQSFPPGPQRDQMGAPLGASRVELSIYGSNLPLNREFEEAVSSPNTPGRAALQKTWKTLLPSGTMDFAAEVVDVPDHPKDLDVRVAVRACTVRPRFFDYHLTDVSAKVSYTHDKVDLYEIHASHGPTHISMPRGQILLHGEEGFKVTLPKVQAEKITPNTEFLNALPPVLRKGLASIKLDGPIDLTTSLEIDQKESTQPPSVSWEGLATMKQNSINTGVEVKNLQGTLSSAGAFDGQQLNQVKGILEVVKGSVLGQPMEHLRANYEVRNDSPNSLRVFNVNGDLFGGHLGAEAYLQFSPQFSYNLHLLGTEIQLEQFGKHNLGVASDMSGPARFGLYLHGNGTELTEMEGDGTVDVSSGKLYRLPPLLDLLKAFGLRRPDQTAFEQAHVKFDIRGGKLRISDLDLIGNAISLRGHGNLNLDGSNVMLDFNADWGHLNQLLPNAVQAIPQFFSDQLFMIKVRGKIGDIKFVKEVIPNVTEPIRKVFTKTP